MNDLATRKTVAEKVEAYKKAALLIQQGYAYLKEAQVILENAYGAQYSSFSTIDHYHHWEGNDAAKNIIERIKRKCWGQFINLLGIRKILSVKRAEQLDRQIEEWKDIPEIEVENVFETFHSLAAQSESFTKEAYKEVFDFLTQGRNQYDHYKTNAKNARSKLGKKVILVGVLNDGYFDRRVDYRQEQKFIALDKVFHALDGKGVPEGYVSPVIDAINTSKDGYGETEYFRFKAYANRNLHIEFKRLDLVEELNKIATDNRSLGY